MSEMGEFFTIPGMAISRLDIAFMVYSRTLPEEEAKAKAFKLTDKQMEYIAEEFTEQFFSVHDGLFRQLLCETMDYIAENVMLFEIKSKDLVI